MRGQETTQEQQFSPVKKRLSFKNKGTKRDPDYKFIYWDADKEEEVVFKLDRFALVDIAFKLQSFTKTPNGEKKGYFSQSNYVNKQYEEVFTLKDSKTNAVIFEGKYDAKKIPSGTSLITVITVEIDGELASITLTPAQARSYKWIYHNEEDDSWRPFSDRYEYYVECTGKEEKEEPQLHEVPTFKIGDKIEDTSVVDALAKEWGEYIKAVKGKQADDKKAEVENEENDMPF